MPHLPILSTYRRRWSIPGDRPLPRPAASNRSRRDATIESEPSLYFEISLIKRFGQADFSRDRFGPLNIVGNGLTLISCPRLVSTLSRGIAGSANSHGSTVDYRQIRAFLGRSRRQRPG